MKCGVAALMWVVFCANGAQAAQPDPERALVRESAFQDGAATDLSSDLDAPRHELEAVLMRFTRAYDGGDINRFMTLFAARVRTEDGEQPAGALRAEYDELFRATMSRRIILRNVHWVRANAGIMAESDFMLSAFSKRDDRTHDKNGALRFCLSKVDSRWLITELYFAYDSHMRQ